MFTKKMLVAGFAAVLFLSGCGNVSPNEQAAPSVSPTQSTTEESTDPSASDRPDTYELNFNDNRQTDPLQQMTLQSSDSIIASQIVEDAVVHLYRNKDKPELVFAAIELNSLTYEIGQIGHSVTQGEADFTIEPVEVFGQPFVKLTGTCGANCPITFYISSEKTPPSVLQVDAHSVEADADGDGTKEIIGTVGTAAATTIYKQQGNSVSGALLNDSLDAAVVLYDAETNQFQAELTAGELVNLKLQGDQLQVVSE